MFSSVQLFFLIFSVLLVTGCSSNHPAVDQSQNGYLEFKEGGFEIIKGYPRYNVTFNVKRTLPSESYLLVTFENPGNSYTPMVKRIKSGKDIFNITSGMIDKIRQDQLYSIKVDVIAGEDVKESIEEYVIFDPEPEELFFFQAELF